MPFDWDVCSGGSLKDPKSSLAPVNPGTQGSGSIRVPGCGIGQSRESPGPRSPNCSAGDIMTETKYLRQRRWPKAKGPSSSVVDARCPWPKRVRSLPLFTPQKSSMAEYVNVFNSIVIVVVLAVFPVVRGIGGCSPVCFFFNLGCPFGPGGLPGQKPVSVS